MNPGARWLIHLVAGMGGSVALFATLPAGWNLWIPAIWIGLTQTAAFLDQSIGKSM